MDGDVRFNAVTSDRNFREAVHPKGQQDQPGGVAGAVVGLAGGSSAGITAITGILAAVTRFVAGSRVFWPAAERAEPKHHVAPHPRPAGDGRRPGEVPSDRLLSRLQ